MKKLIFTFVAFSLFSGPLLAQTASTKDDSFLSDQKDRRHWRDRLNDNNNYYGDRFDDGSRPQRDSNAYRVPTRPQPLRSESECKYVERIDSYGERHFDFICP